MKIDVQKNPYGKFDVTIVEGGSSSAHRVSVGAAHYEKLTGGRVPMEELVRRSFEFLLEREPKEAILSEFDLSVISRYFPEYEREITKRP